MNYADIKPFDIANGVGIRISLFVSGCRNYCKGCFNPEAWSFDYGREFDMPAMAEIVAHLTNPNVRGLSILGGDPFEPENIDTVTDICRAIKSEFPEKDIWCWTGYSYEDLKALPIMKYLDVLVDGKFEQDKKDLRLKWRGSSNQRVIDVQESLKSGEAVLYSE